MGALPFAIVSSIDPEKPETWRRRIFLTLDVDWASDEVLDHAIDLVESAGAAATWLVTHKTPVLDRMRNNPLFEAGIHPNFNGLLMPRSAGDKDNARDIVARLMRIVPEAKSVRSHGAAQSAGLHEIFRAAGLTRELNHFIPASAGMELKPFTLWNGLVKVPYFWEDDVALAQKWAWNPAELLRARGLKVFNFHPIHIALNTTDMKIYDSTRDIHHDWKRLRRRACRGKGVRSMLESLLEAGR